MAYLRRDGYGEIVDDGRARPYNRVGQDVSDKDVLAARANATFVWGDSSRLRILADTVQDNSNAAGGQRPEQSHCRRRARPRASYPRLNDRYDQRTDMPVDQDRFINKGVAATYTQSLTDALDLKVVGAYREGEGRQFIDFDELNANLFQVPAQYSDDQTSGEVQLTYTSDLVQRRRRRLLLHRPGHGRVRCVAGLAGPDLAHQGQRRYRQHRGVISIRRGRSPIA